MIPDSLANMIAVELSQYILIGNSIEGITPSPEINFLIQTAYIAASAATMYSASVADIAMVLCFLVFQTAPPF
jgi:hypothetical protein